ncbi:putative uncharacterized protein DDB_G0279653 isoform X2 [Tripterygium wilfordii]|uniref:putative uncharacterized protein DDB_G0279653 isoform X2 n=1 Tax=Tripterygium wilfordii TaxID=458696 RepID=UPI0018F8272A|nr:putative uncharacterized protein DDB_G0279653 isoform X2 [Tripterygium wilfordii]
MDRDSLRNNNGLLLRASAVTTKQTRSSDFVLQWGNRKRLRCSKIQARYDSTAPVQSATVRIDRRVIRSDKGSSNHHNIAFNHKRDVYLNLRQRPVSPQAPPPPRVLRNSENSSAMRGHSNGGLRGLASPDRGTHERKGANNNHHNNNINHRHNNVNNQENNKSAGSSETAHDSKKGGSSSGSGEAAAPPAWPPKLLIALTNKEKEEDFIAFKGSKLPQRPKKRAKFIQRSLNLVSPGAWLCDLTLERYEVREKKISKKILNSLNRCSPQLFLHINRGQEG